MPHVHFSRHLRSEFVKGNPFVTIESLQRQLALIETFYIKASGRKANAAKVEIDMLEEIV